MAQKSFTLADLTRTSQKANNTPSEPETKNLLTYLKPLLEKIYSDIGPFTLASAFRSAAVQAKLTAAGLPTAKTKSYHEAGLAADIIPANGMTLRQYYQKLYEAPWAKSMIGELAIKEEEGQNAIHISAQAPGTTGFKPLYLQTDELTGVSTYVALTDDLKKIIFTYPTATASAGVLVVAALGALWWFMGKKKGASSPQLAAANPARFVKSEKDERIWETVKSYVEKSSGIPESRWRSLPKSRQQKIYGLMNKIFHLAKKKYKNRELPARYNPYMTPQQFELEHRRLLGRLLYATRELNDAKAAIESEIKEQATELAKVRKEGR